jgi:hypothetical protein
MERRIEEKYSGPWRVLWLFAAFPILMAVAAPFGSWMAGHGFVDVLLPAAMAIASVFFMMGFAWWLSKDQKKIWFLTEDGLLRVDSCGKRTPISWEQIQDMKWNGLIGLIIRWYKPQPGRKNKTFYEDVRTSLGIEERDARELLLIWKEKKVKSEDPREIGTSHKTYPVRAGDAGRNAGKLILVGILGFLGAVLSITKREWWGSLLWGAASAAAFGLSFWLLQPSVGKHRAISNWLLLLALAAVVFGIALMQNKLGFLKK